MCLHTLVIVLLQTHWYSFRQIPTFGRDKIRKFSANASELKKLAARDYEDLLQVQPLVVETCAVLLRESQCIIPVFDGLLPDPHNAAILQLLSVCAQWHGLAKLRMHTDHTLKLLNITTVALGQKFRAFANDTCSAFNTRELQREVEARARRQASKGTTAVANSTRRPKKLNLQTYKFHSLGDYEATIRRYGTTDSYSTEVVSVPNDLF